MESFKEWLNIVDGVVAVVLVLGLLGGMRRGLSGELLRVITVMIALLAGWYGAEGAAAWLAERSDWPLEDLRLVGLIGLIAGVYFGLGIVRHTFRLFLDFTFRGRIELLGGAFLGLVRATLFCAVALLGASLIPSEAIQQALGESRTGQAVLEHLTPAYNSWAGSNPDLKLPVKEDALPVEEVAPIDLPAVEPPEPRESEVLGPLLDEAPVEDLPE